MSDAPIYSTAAEAWQALSRDVPHDHHDLARGIFYAGMAAALSIIFHHGAHGLHREIERENVHGRL